MPEPRKRYRPCYEYISGGSGTKAFGPRPREEAVEQLREWIRNTVDQPLKRSILLARAEHDPERPQRVEGSLAVWFQWIEEMR